MALRELAVLRRPDAFLSDPFFASLAPNVQERIAADLIPVGEDDHEHNLQVTVSNDKFLVQLELPGFEPSDFSLKSRADEAVILEAVHEDADSATGEFTTRSYKKAFPLPEGVLVGQLTSTYSSDGILSIEAPRKLEVPEGADLQEAMAAQSRAYTTDDGKTAVKEDSRASSQQMSAVTESPDGRVKSSMSFTSSSSSASSVVSSNTGAPLSLGMSTGFPRFGNEFPAALESTDDIMKRMMGNMGNLGISDNLRSNLTSNMSSIKTSSTSSTEEHQMRGSSLMQGFPSMLPPSRMGFDMMPPWDSNKKLDIEELSNAGSDISGAQDAQQQQYTVTSPTPVDKKTNVEKRHATQSDPQSDHTVLLKLKEGDEYKLVLNLQRYAPENISLKLNDKRELTLTARGREEKGEANLVQRHLVPDHIDLDQMTSTLSADGILVVKAPKKNIKATVV